MKVKDIKPTEIHTEDIKAPEQSKVVKKNKKKTKKTGPKKPWKMTPETLTKLEAAFSFGANDIEACLYADISTRTLARYEETHEEFCLRKEALRSKTSLAAKQTVARRVTSRKVKILNKDGELVDIDVEGDGDLALKYLERKQPDEFGMKKTIKHEGGVEVRGATEMAKVLQAILEEDDITEENQSSSGDNS